jgi:uncharacterized membrane protein YagU involved in acid resistance
MTGAQTIGRRLGSSDEGAVSGPRDPWEEAPAPAQVAKLIGEAVLGVHVPSRAIPMLTHVMHWGYGTAWGAVYGLAHQCMRPETLTARRGAAFGLCVWAMSYVQLVPLGIYRPPWAYPATELTRDAAYHLAYGLGTAMAFRA